MKKTAFILLVLALPLMAAKKTYTFHEAQDKIQTSLSKQIKVRQAQLSCFKNAKTAVCEKIMSKLAKQIKNRKTKLQCVQKATSKKSLSQCGNYKRYTGIKRSRKK